jgi:6-phosphogluconolactonase
MADYDPARALVAADSDALAHALAVRVAQHAQQDAAVHGEARLLLAGGNTPRLLHHHLLATALPWAQTDIFLGDERLVPPDHADSNFRMIRESLLAPLEAAGTPVRTTHRWRTERGADAAAAQYDALLRAMAGPGDAPRFSCILLGMGADGHTASLFPHTAALLERVRLAVSNAVPQLATTRLTVTFPLLYATQSIYLLVTGREKGRVLHEALTGPHEPDRLPVQALFSQPGFEPILCLDAAAAAELGLAPA